MLTNQRHLFDIPDDVAYLNCAYLSPLMHPVIAAGRAGLDRKAWPWELHAEDFWNEPNRGRELFARLINADADGVAIVPSASYGMATAALNLPVRKGQKIIVLQDQFPSNVTHWVDLAVENEAKIEAIARSDDFDWTSHIMEAIDETTAIAALPNCHWTDGSLINLVAVGKRCREVGAALVLDITQSAGAMAIDVPAIQPSFLVAAGYKWLMAPYSVGFLWVAPRHRQGRAFELGFVARAAHPAFAHLSSYELPFNISAHRFDVGESGNFALMPAANAALEQLLEWTPVAIQETLAHYTQPIAQWAREQGLNVADDRLRAGHYVGIRFPGGLPEGAVGRLEASGVFISERADFLRITPHLYNTEQDRARLLDGLAGLVELSGWEVA